MGSSPTSRPHSPTRARSVTLQLALNLATLIVAFAALWRARKAAPMSALTDLQAAVSVEVAAVAQAVTTIQGLAAQIAAAVASNDSAALETLTQQLSASAASLSAAVSAAPVATPAPAPVAKS